MELQTGVETQKGNVRHGGLVTTKNSRTNWQRVECSTGLKTLLLIALESGAGEMPKTPPQRMNPGSPPAQTA